MFYVKFFTFYFLVLFSQLQANNPPTKNISLQKVIHSFQLPLFKNKTQAQLVEDSISFDKKSQVAALVAQQVEKSRSLESCTKSEAKIFDIHSIQSHIVYVIHAFKELCIKLMTSACEKDDDIWVQLEDVYFNGRYYRYHVLSDAARKETKWDSCNLWPYDDSMHCLSFDDRAEFEAALRGGASVAQIYQMAGLYPDGSQYSGEMRVSNIQSDRSSSGGSSTSSQDLTPSKGTSTGGTASGQQNESSTGSQSGGSSSSNGVSTGNAGSLSTGTSGIYDINPSKQKPVQHAPQQSLSSSTGLQTVMANQAATENAFMQQNFNTISMIERGFSQKYPDLAALIIKDREEVSDATDAIINIQKAENPGRWVSFFGRKPEINVSYTAQQVQHAQTVLKAGQQNSHWHRNKALVEAHKIVQVDAAAKAEALKKEQERIAAAKKAADEKKAFDDQQSKSNQMIHPVNSQSTSFGTQVLNSVVAAYKKDCDEGGSQRREYERKMQEEQQSITHQRYIQQQKVAQHRASIIQDKYTQQRKIEIAYLGRHGYTYQPSEQDFIELTIHQLRLESARNRYNGMNTLSYDYLMSSKAAELKKLIKDSDAKVHNLQNKIAKQRYEWDAKSLQEIADKKKSGKIVTGQADNARNESAHELLDVEKIDDIVDMENLTEYVHPTDDSTSSQDLVKDSEHRYTMPSTIAQAIRNKLIDRDNEYSNKVSANEIAMIDYMLHAMVKAQNNMTVEYAQAGLDACEKAQHAKTDDEHVHHIKKAELYYNTIKNGQANYSIADKAAPVKASDLDAMLQNYNKVLESNKNTALPNQQQTNSPFIDRFEKRAQAITESQEQLRTNKLISCDFKMSSQARGYLMANNLNYAAFDTIKATSIQHCLTRENLEIIESVTEMAQRHGYTPETKEFVKQVCDLAIVAQQLNQQSKIQEAAAVTDLNCISAYFAQFTMEDDPELLAFLAMGTGPAKALYNLGCFFVQLGFDPLTTTNKLAKDAAAIGNCLACAVAELSQHSQNAYERDICNDLMNNLVDSWNNVEKNPAESKFLIRVKRNELAIQNGKTVALNTALNVISDIQERPIEETMTDLSEMIFDAYLTTKVLQGAHYVSRMMGTKLLNLADKLKKTIPAPIIDEAVVFMQTSTGEIIAVTEKTGKDLSIVAKNQIAVNRATQAEKIIEKKKFINNKVCELTKPNPKRLDAFKKSMEPYLNSEKIINIERLQTIKDVEQINNFRKYTNNFTNLEKLTSEEILYLNLCDWLEYQAVKINDKVKLSGGRMIIDPISGAEGFFEGYNLNHSLMGEMSPEALANRVSGGHLMIPELRAATLDIGKVTTFGDGFFDMEIQYAGKVSNKFKNNSYFPAGTSVEQATEMIEKAIANPKLIECTVIDNKIVSFIIKDQSDQFFTIYIKKGIASFHPTNPEALKHLL